MNTETQKNRNQMEELPMGQEKEEKTIRVECVKEWDE